MDLQKVDCIKWIFKRWIVKSRFVKGELKGWIQGRLEKVIVKGGFAKGGFVNSGFLKSGIVKGVFVKHGFLKQ